VGGVCCHGDSVEVDDDLRGGDYEPVKESEKNSVSLKRLEVICLACKYDSDY
jgi:hypothetical protein